jgi:kumamolisin
MSTPVIVKGTPLKPTVISISWGLPEIYLSSAQLTAANNAFAAAAAAGISITAATGDNGSNNGVGGTGNYTDFPSSSPNVIAVGGTSLSCPNRIYDNSTVETAWSAGGGGISRYYAKPSYQSSLSGTRRQTPDVASVADPETGVLFIVNGQTVVYGGTSVSSPTIAAYIACIDKTAWANPLLYAGTQTFYNDILIGSNGGYIAKVGFDNTTGLGSIKGDLLKTAFGTRISSFRLNAASINLGTAKTFQAITNILPVNADNKNVIWSSSNPARATVSSSGLITGVSAGTLRINATTVDGGKVASVFVSVFTSVTGVTLSPASITLRRNRTTTLAVTVLPSGAANKSYTTTVANPAIAVVRNGRITGRSIGTTTVTVTTMDGGFTATATITVI